jgi:hypothetical protein
MWFYVLFIQFQFFYVSVSIHQTIQSVLRTQPNEQTATRQFTPQLVFFESKVFVRRTPLRTYFVEINTLYLQCQSTARKRHP